MKKITSLTLGISFLIMTYTGIMLFIAPHGRVAYWSDWTLLGLGKDGYGNLHTTSMIIFLLFGILHIYYNWRPIVSYLKNQQKKVSFTKKEFLIALAINMVFLVGTVSMMQPFKAFLDFEEQLKDSWTETYGEPPYGHAELSKLKIFCKKTDINLDQAKSRLKESKIDFDENETLLDIAKNNHMAPSDIYAIIKDTNATEEDTNTPPARLGRKTLQQLSDMKYIDLDKSIRYLKSKQIKNVDPQDRIKDLADELSLTPIKLFELLKAL